MDKKERNKILYKSSKRGCRELDLLLGNFAKEMIFILSEEDFNDYKRVVSMEDPELYQYLVNGERPKYCNSIIEKILEFSKKREFTKHT